MSFIPEADDPLPGEKSYNLQLDKAQRLLSDLVDEFGRRTLTGSAAVKIHFTKGNSKKVEVVRQEAH